MNWLSMDCAAAGWSLGTMCPASKTWRRKGSGGSENGSGLVRLSTPSSKAGWIQDYTCGPMGAIGW